MREFLVFFDELQHDHDGCGPYYAAVIWEKYLRSLTSAISSGEDPDGYRVELIES